MKMGQIAALAAVLIAAPAATFAGEVIVTGSTAVLPSATSWGTIPGENTGGGATAITTTAPQSGDGSLELIGDRTRYQIGIQYGGLTNLGSVRDFQGLAFDWRIAGDSVSGYSPFYTPALRLIVQDGTQRSELIWEGANNGTYGNTQRDTWYSTTFNDTFYQNVAGPNGGVTFSGGAQVNKTIAAWLATYSANAYVSAISVGAGSGALPTYHAFVDNVKVLFANNDVTTYNFEVSAAANAVPEPATWAAMLMGFGALGVTARRRRGAKASA